MIFNCAICKAEVCIADQDVEMYRAHGWECGLCYSVIAKRRYTPRNTPGTVTLFSPCSSALGDQVVEKIVRERYEEDNPNEEIVHLNLCDANEAVRIYRPDKFFWATITNFMSRPQLTKFERIGVSFGMKNRKNVIDYSVAVEAKALGRERIYPSFGFTDKDSIDVGDGPFAVLNFRNIVKCTFKNAEPYLVNSIFLYLQRFISSGALSCAVLVGNDDHWDDVCIPEWVVDFRKKLTLQQIASLCSRSRIYIGKDCGVAHLAAAAGAKNMVLWGYRERQWIVNTSPDRFTALFHVESSPDKIKNTIAMRMASRNSLPAPLGTPDACKKKPARRPRKPIKTDRP